jgi:hypothetical protein
MTTTNTRAAGVLGRGGASVSLRREPRGDASEPRWRLRRQTRRDGVSPLNFAGVAGDTTASGPAPFFSDET